MRRLIASLVLLLTANSAADADATLYFDLNFSDISQGAVLAFPFNNLPEGWCQGSFDETPVPRHNSGKFLIKTTSAVLGVRG